MNYETEVDRLIMKWKGSPLTRLQHKRGRFRRAHHYFSFLKYWSTYQEKFAYLDAKSQGLLAMSAILTTAFAVLIGGTSKNDGILTLIAIWGSFAGMGLLIGAQMLLLRCLSTTVSKEFPEFVDDAVKLESRVRHGGGAGYFGRTRTLESNLNYFLKLHLEMIQEIGPRHARRKLNLERVWEDIRADSTDTFDSFEKDVSKFFGKLRHAVEHEVSKRHDHYHMARRLVFVTLFQLLACVVSYSLAKAM